MTSTVALVRAVMGVLEGQLPAKLADADLPPVEKWLLYDATLHPPITAPTLWVVVTQITPVAPAGFGGSNRHHTRSRLVQIGFTCAGQDPETAQLALCSYADLIQETVLANLTAGGTATDVKPGRVRLDLDLPRENALPALYKFGLLEFAAERWSGLGSD